MKKVVFLGLMSMLFFIIEIPAGVTASQSEGDFDPADHIKSHSGEPAEGFDPVDDMYVKADKNHYWKGRYSNGRIFSEYLANELTGDYDNLLNYAVGGTMSGVMTGTEGEEDERSNWSEWLKGWGGVQQTERFVEEMDGHADPEGLYIIEVGGNDDYAVEDLGKERTAELSGDYTLEMVQNLVESGAKYILLPGVFADDRTDLTDIDDMRNKQVDENIQAYLAEDSTPDDVEVIYGDSDRLRENIDEQGYEEFGYKSMGFYMISDWVPAYGYGLVSEDNSDIFPTNQEEADYDGYDNYSTASKYYAPEAADWEPNDFYTFDEYHLTNRSQKHKATYLLNSDIESEDGTFEKTYNGEVSPFAEAIDDGTIPSKYSEVYTFGASSIDSGRALEVTTELVENRNKDKDEKQEEAHKVFADINKNNAHYEGINALTKEGIIQGYPMKDGTKTFKPYESLSREHASALLTKTLDLDIPDPINSELSHFDDVSLDHLYADEISAAHHAGIFTGDDGYFNGNQPLTREQMATVLVRAYDLESNKDQADVNLKNVDDSHRKNVQILAELKITNQLEDFRPHEDITRGQFATLLHKTMKKIESSS